MKRKDVFIQILSEVAEQPKELVTDLLDAFTATIPGQHKFDEDISDKEYEELLFGLRKEKEGIKQWLMKGQLQVLLQNAKPQGHA